MLKKQDIATDILVIGMMVILFLNQFMFRSNARIGEKEGLTAGECLGANYIILIAITVLLFVSVILKKDKENLNFVAGIIASVCFGCVILFCGQAANVVEVPQPNGRLSMSLGSYLYIVLAYLVEVKCNEYIQKKWKRFLVVVLGLLIMAAVFLMGQLDGLSVMKEYGTYQDQFAEYFRNHISMSFGVVTWVGRI